MDATNRSPVKIKCSLRDELFTALAGCADLVREETWEQRGPHYAETARRYDRREAARSLLSEFARTARVRKREVAELEDALAASLPESIDDLDGMEVFEWLERTIPITWDEDRLLLPEALRPELVAIVLDALGGAVEGEMTPDQRATAARRVFERVLPGKLSARAKYKEGELAHRFITLAWGARHEPELRANMAVEWLESELKIRWLTPARGEQPYSASAVYEVGDVVVHPRFGRGTVKARTDTSIDVAFADGTRKLTAGSSVRTR